MPQTKEKKKAKNPFTNPVIHAIIFSVLARWCSRLARQPVTLEVDGSSPFRVAKKIVILWDGYFFVPGKGLEQLSFIGSSLPTGRTRRRDVSLP